MANKRDYYEVLGVDKNATPEEIKKKFRVLSKNFHPDKQIGKTDAEKKEAEEKFKEIAEAYEVLSDKEKRQQYDTYGFAGGSSSANDFGFSGMDINDLFSHYSDIFGGYDSFMWGSSFDNFSGFGGGYQQAHANKPRKGSDLRIRLNISMSESINGGTRKIKLKRQIKCSHCQGTGSEDGTIDTCLNCGGTGTEIKTQRTPFGISQVASICHECGGTGKTIRNKCHECHGTGLVEREEIVEVFIVPGLLDGSVFRMVSYGNYPTNPKQGDLAGDLIVVIGEIIGDEFVHRGNDIIYKLVLDLPTAVLGGNVEIPMPDGSKKRVQIKPGTQPGSVLRKTGAGIPKIDSAGNKIGVGDFLIEISVYIPEKLTSEERTIFESLKNSKSFEK